MPSARPTTSEQCAPRPLPNRGPTGIDLVATVTTPAPYTVGTDGPFTIVAYDFGIKRTILRHLAGFGQVEVVPASTSAADVLAREPAGVFLSNGPGDPSEVPYAVEAIRELLGEVPIFGICLGHQLLGRAMGAETVKLPFGHHGGNHPVQDLDDRRTSRSPARTTTSPSTQARLPGGVELTHVNLNDVMYEGLAMPRRPRVLRAAPSRGGAGPARQLVPVRPVLRGDGGPPDQRPRRRPNRPARPGPRRRSR